MSEIIGASDFISWILWMTQLMENKVNKHFYQDKVNKHFYQDNESPIKIEKNGQKSCSSKSRHLNVRIFFINDHLGRNYIQITHCKSEDMIADFFAKPISSLTSVLT